MNFLFEITISIEGLQEMANRLQAGLDVSGLELKTTTKAIKSDGSIASQEIEVTKVEDFLQKHQILCVTDLSKLEGKSCA